MTSNLRALIFDVDGTLAETEEAHRDAFNMVFKEWDLPWHWDQALYGELLDVTGGKERLRHYVCKYTPPQAGRFLAADQNVVALHKRKTEIYMDLVRTGRVPLRPGVARLLDEAREADVQLAISTTTNIKPLQALFEGTLGIEALDWFDAVAAGDMAENKKPAPDLYDIALEDLGLSPQECLAIEDSRNGLKSAQAAGLPVIITKSVYTSHQHFPEALAVMSDLGEPDAPFTPLGGMATISGVCNLALLNEWLGRCR